MNNDWSPQAFQEELSRLPQGEQLTQAVRQVADKLLTTRRRDVPSAAAPLLKATAFNRTDNQTTLGDPVAALERGPRERSERLLLGALLARATGASPPSGVEAEDRAASDLLWLAAHGGIDAFPSLDAALGARAAGLWGALCDLVRRIDGGREPSLDRADALCGAAALRSATLPDARAAAQRLADEVEDPQLAEMLRGRQSGDAGSAPRLTGELISPPRSALVTTLLAVTGLLLLLRASSLLARLALNRRHPAELEITREGVRIRARTEMLGRVLREVEHVVPLDGLAVATREVRFPRLALYAGLLALALGSYVGSSLLGDGFKAASPSLLGQGLLVAAIGVAIELAASTLFPGAKGRCNLLFVPKKGGALCVSDVDIEAARKTLSLLPAKT